MYYFFIFFSLFVVFDSFLSRMLKWKGTYYLVHTFHNILVTFYTFHNTLDSYLLEMKGELSLKVIEILYSLHVYHFFVYYHKINMEERIHHIVCLGLAIPIVCFFFENRNLLGFSFFSTTGPSSIATYLVLFLYKNNLVSKDQSLHVNYICSTYLRNPLILMNVSLIAQFIFLSWRELTTIQLILTSVLLLILYINGVFFQSLVAMSYWKIRNI